MTPLRTCEGVPHLRDFIPGLLWFKYSVFEPVSSFSEESSKLVLHLNFLVATPLDHGVRLGNKRERLLRSSHLWYPEQDSNLRPSAPEADALSPELSGRTEIY